jgi:hypothetical protein
MSASVRPTRRSSPRQSRDVRQRHERVGDLARPRLEQRAALLAVEPVRRRAARTAAGACGWKDGYRLRAHGTEPTRACCRAWRCHHAATGASNRCPGEPPRGRIAYEHGRFG